MNLSLCWRRFHKGNSSLRAFLYSTWKNRQNYRPRLGTFFKYSECNKDLAKLSLI